MTTGLLGGGLFVLSGLALLGLTHTSWGGTAGVLLASPLVALFDVFATKVILAGLVCISLLIFFDATPSKIMSLILAPLLWIRNRFVNARESDSGVTLSGEVSDESQKDEPDTEEPDAEKIAEEKLPLGASSRDALKTKRDEIAASLFKPLQFLQSKKYTPPPLSLLEEDRGKPGVGDIKANANIIKRTLQNFGISVEMDEVSVGPSFTRYALKPAQGIKLSRIITLQNDLSLALAAHPLRIEAPIPGKSLAGIEIPNSKKITVGLGSLLKSPQIKDASAPLAFPVGRNISGEVVVRNLNKMPHLLIAGATGSGKSVMIHTIITSLLYRNSPAHMRFIMIDRKRVELTLYNNIPHLLTPVITEPKKAILALKWAGKEMDRRYDILEAEAVRDIESYHKNVVEPAYKHAKEETPDASLPELLPYIVIVLDELADIMGSYPRELESAIVRLAQMSRAVGIHLILSTQRPQVAIITGLIKANIPARIALQVSSQTDSRTILDMGGAEKLLGAGDMLFLAGDMGKPMRLQSAYIGEPEIKKVVQFLSSQNTEDAFGVDLSLSSSPKDAIFLSETEEEESEDADSDDALYAEARDIVIQNKKASTTYLQRKLKIGYARAARIMDMLEERGVIGPGEGAKPREILVSADEQINMEAAEDTESFPDEAEEERNEMRA